MKQEASNLNSLWADLIIEELLRNRIDYFCLSPGSRSTPLASAVATNKRAGSLMHLDERGTAFHALGHARATGRPAVLICTSGTAVANYMPAVVEASMDMVPMILLTADRPPELRQSFANQTIDQVKIFGDYVRWQFDLPCPDENIPAEFVLTSIDQAVYRSIRAPAGPVHLNCMFREPLVPDDTHNDSDMLSLRVRSWRKGEQPYTRYEAAREVVDPDKLSDLASAVNHAKDGLLIIGALKSDAERQSILRVSKKLGWPVLADISSGLRLGVRCENIIPYYDHILSHESAASVKEPMVLHVGGRLTSKRLLQFLEDTPLKHYIMVADHPFRHDPLHRVTTRIEADITILCESLMPVLSNNRDHKFPDRFKAAARVVDEALEDIAGNDTQLNEPACARLISKHISGNTGLFLASSMPIRDMDMFADAKGPAVPIGCNRGASGIDGTIASASGFAAGLGKPMTLLIGDLAFLHDLNSLAVLKSLLHPMVIVVINNNGGGIFSFLPIAGRKDIFESFFSMPHDLGFENTARMFGLDYHSPETKDSFVSCYQSAQNKGTSAIIEVKSDRNENYQIHQDIDQRIATALDNL